MIYKNLSRATKTFYGVVFKPGDEHDVPGHINHPKFVRLMQFTNRPEIISKPVKALIEAPVTHSKKSTKTKNITKEEVIADGTNCD